MFVAALIAFGSVSGNEVWLRLRKQVETSPREVSAFIQRRAGCNHFFGEVSGSGDERDVWLAKQLRIKGCWRLERDERRLRAKYRRDGGVLKLMDDTKDILGW